MAGLDLAGEFGSGIRNDQAVSYVGMRGEGYYPGLPCRRGGFYTAVYINKAKSCAMSVMENCWISWGVMTFIPVSMHISAVISPLADGLSCVFSAVAAGELQLWYYWSDDVYGGNLSGSVYATVACIISGRGQVDLEYAHLDNGGSIKGRTCNNSYCDAYAVISGLLLGWGGVRPAPGTVGDSVGGVTVGVILSGCMSISVISVREDGIGTATLIMNDIYSKLAEYMNNLPGSFPATEDGVELRILQRLFTPEQAALTLHLTMVPEPARIIARRAGLAPGRS